MRRTAILLASLAPAAALHSKGLTSSAWARARCGPEDTSITQWGAAVTPDAQPAYPRPQLTRGAASWVSLNGLWEWENVGVSSSRDDAPCPPPHPEP